MKIFKVLSVMMIVALSAGFASCSNDDDKDFDAANLVGTWQATHSEGWYKDTDYPEDDETWNGAWEDTNDSSLMPSQMQFNADGTGVDISDFNSTYNQNFKWILKGDNLSMTYSYEDAVVSKIVEMTATKVVVEISFDVKSESGFERTTYTRVK